MNKPQHFRIRRMTICGNGANEGEDGYAVLPVCSILAYLPYWFIRHTMADIWPRVRVLLGR